jgi:putative transposase
MRAPYTQLFVHCVWATWDRLPLITSAVEQRLYASITTKCRELDCVVLALGGVEDHVHLLVRIPTTLTIAGLVREVKGSSSHLMTHAISPNTFFKWQGAYGAFSVSKDDIDRVAAYIQAQKTHHSNVYLIAEWEISQSIQSSRDE